MASWQEIRALRALPPGLAHDDEQRREVFGASLQQAEELATASASVGYSTKPILLFYALCQGFRAACAARLPSEWERSGHGLAFRSAPGSVLDSTVLPAAGKRDLYAGAMSIVEETPMPGKLSISELLSLLFEFRDSDVSGRELPRHLILRLPYLDNQLADPGTPAPAETLMAMVVGLPGDLPKEELPAALNAYPTLEGGQPVDFPSGIQTGVLWSEEDHDGIAYLKALNPPAAGPLFRFQFDGSTVSAYLARYEELAPGHIGSDRLSRVATPGVGEGHWLLGPLTPWWATLLGFSSLARYHPSQWRKILDIDREAIAPNIEKVLDQAEKSIPYYVFHALTSAESED